MNPKNLPTPAQVPAGHVIAWFATGWRLFLAAPAVWVLQTLVFIALFIVIAIIPVFGQLAVIVSFPIFCAGMIHGCDLLQRGEPLEIRDLFAGFERQTPNLIVLGGGYLLGFGVIFTIAVAIGSSSALVGYLLGNLGGLGAFLGGLALASLIGYSLWILLLMALWFAPALVMLGGVPPLQALLLSARACGRNLPAFALMALALYLISSLVVLSAMLALLVVIPLIAGAVYASWRDVFGHEFASLLADKRDHGAPR